MVMHIRANWTRFLSKQSSVSQEAANGELSMGHLQDAVFLQMFILFRA